MRNNASRLLYEKIGESDRSAGDFLFPRPVLFSCRRQTEYIHVHECNVERTSAEKEEYKEKVLRVKKKNTTIIKCQQRESVFIPVAPGFHRPRARAMVQLCGAECDGGAIFAYISRRI